MQKLDPRNAMDDDATMLISVSDLLATLWQGRRTIVAITALAAICGLAWAQLNITYLSQGFFQFGGPIPMLTEFEKEQVKTKEREFEIEKLKIKIKESEPVPEVGIAPTDFRRYAAANSNVDRFNEFVREKKLESTPDLNDLRKAFVSRAGISTIVEPVFTLAKMAPGPIAPPKDENQKVVGLRISYAHPSAESAQKAVALLGSYAMDRLIYFAYSDMLVSRIGQLKTTISELDNDIIQYRIQMEDYDQNSANLKKIIASNPAAAGLTPPPMISLTQSTMHYLSPFTLLISNEVRVAQTNEAILKIKRTQAQNALLLEFYERARKVVEATKSGETVLRNLEPAKEAVFKEKNMQDHVIRQLYNMITLDNQNAIRLYLDKSHFIAGPTLPGYPTVSPVKMLGVSAILGFLLSILYVFIRKRRRVNAANL